MIEGISLLIICIFCSLLAFVSAIITIIKRKEKSGIIALLITLFALFGAVYSGITFAKKTFTTVKASGTKVADIVVEATAEVLSSRYSESAFMDSIISVQPKDKNIPSPYFYCCGFRDYQRMPLIYPYSMIIINADKYASIVDETNVKNVFASNNGSKDIIANVSKFLFNQLFLIGKQYNSNSTKYFLLKFDTGELITFDKEKEIKKYLENMGIGYPDNLFTPTEYFKRFGK